MSVDNIQYYIGRDSKLGEWDCIALVEKFYEKEIGVKIKLPTYSSFDDIYKYTSEYLEDYVKDKFIKISLDNARSKDIIVFTSKGNNKLFHFGIFFMPHYILHIEKNGKSIYEPLSDRYRDRVHCLLRIKNELY